MLKCLRRYLKHLWQRTLGSRSAEMWRLLVNGMGTNASWETVASFFSVRQEVGDIRWERYMQQPPLKRPSSASLRYCHSLELLRWFPLPLPLNVTTDSTQWHLVSVYLPLCRNLWIAHLCHLLARRPSQYITPYCCYVCTVTEHPLPGLFRVLQGNIFEGE
jgi:hypothetical protein